MGTSLRREEAGGDGGVGVMTVDGGPETASEDPWGLPRGPLPRGNLRGSGLNI